MSDNLRRALERAVRRICPPWLSAQAQDIVQDAWLRVEKARDRAEESGPRHASYLWKAAHSAVMDEIRRYRRRREEPLEDATGSPPPAAGPGDRDRTLALRRGLREGLAGLAPDRRAAVLLYLYGHTLKESAAMLGWTVKRVDNQRYQGLAELRRLLERKGLMP